MRQRQAPFELITLGDLVADLIAPIPSLPIEAGQHQRLEWLQMEAGGTSNTLIMAARLGLRPVAIGALGDDPPGRLVASILRREQVNLDGLAMLADQKTPTSMVFVDDRGDHVFVGALGSAGPMPFQERWHALLQRAPALFTTGYAMHPGALFGPDNNLQCMRAARAAGCRIFMDLGPSAFIVEPDRVAAALALAHVILSTADEIREWTGMADPVRGARRFLSDDTDSVVVKLGPEGCVIVNAHKEVACPGFAVALRDSVGAGDAFAAGYIAGRLADMDEFAAGMIANAVGAATVTRLGTGSLLPPLAEVTALLESRSLPTLPWTTV